MKILVVDNEELNLDVIQGALEETYPEEQDITYFLFTGDKDIPRLLSLLRGVDVLITDFDLRSKLICGPRLATKTRLVNPDVFLVSMSGDPKAKNQFLDYEDAELEAFHFPLNKPFGLQRLKLMVEMARKHVASVQQNLTLG